MISTSPPSPNPNPAQAFLSQPKVVNIPTVNPSPSLPLLVCFLNAFIAESLVSEPK